jgi:hypothetical protein
MNFPFSKVYYKHPQERPARYRPRKHHVNEAQNLFGGFWVRNQVVSVAIEGLTTRLLCPKLTGPDLRYHGDDLNETRYDNQRGC